MSSFNPFKRFNLLENKLQYRLCVVSVVSHILGIKLEARGQQTFSASFVGELPQR